MRKPTSVDEYRSWMDERQLAAIDRLREVIGRAVPQATFGAGDLWGEQAVRRRVAAG